MARLSIVLFVLLLLLIGACTEAPPENSVADGEACASTFDCKSSTCMRGLCQGRGCKLDDPSSCDPGWRCTELKGGLLSSGSVRCVPLCGKCPADKHCAVGGEDGVSPCEDGPPRKVTITGPDKVKVTTSVTFSIAVEPPFDAISSVEWRVGEKVGLGQSFGNEMTFTGPLDVSIEGDFFLSAIVHGSNKEGAAQVFGTAEGSKPIRHDCLSEGDVCKVNGDSSSEPQICCARGLYCPGQTGSTAPRHCEVLK